MHVSLTKGGNTIHAHKETNKWEVRHVDMQSWPTSISTHRKKCHGKPPKVGWVGLCSVK